MSDNCQWWTRNEHGYLCNLMTAILFSLMLSSSYSSSHADFLDDFQELRNRGNQLSEDMITCAAFFTISAQGGKNSGTQSSLKLAENLEHQAVIAMMFAKSIANSIGQKPEVANIRLKAIMQSILDEMNWNYINYSSIMHKYLNNCVELLRDPEKTIKSRLKIPPNIKETNPK